MNSKVYLKDCDKFSQLHRGCLLFYNLYIYLTRGLFIPPWHYIFLHCSFLNQVMQHYYYYCLFFFALWQFAAPTVAPTITSAVRTNATTARIMWSAVDTMAAGGIISHYSVRYRPKDYPNENCNNTNASTWTTNTKTADGSSILITELIPTRDYCVAVAATNNAGTGIYSRPVQRKWRLWHNFFQPLQCKCHTYHSSLLHTHNTMLIFLSAVPAPRSVQITLGGIRPDCNTWIVSNIDYYCSSSITSKLLCMYIVCNISESVATWSHKCDQF